ncbi:hypothetical protein BR93DRAFT_246465 [Coniochaeta sp. PMI_546]|nr:hypothetical protein BR93DRAFT_246465 [Coniochaeta sp. PMI_546]
MHYLQSQRETQHRKVGRTRQLPVPRSKALSTPPKLRDKPTLQTPKISWTTASRERQHELLSRRCATGAPPDGLEHSVHTSRTKESGELFRVEVSRDLVPSQSILGVVGQDDRSRPGRGIYTIALKTYEQISQGYFKSEEAIFESMRGAVGRLWASWVQGYVLKLEYVAGTIFEQTYGSSSHSTPPYPSISGAPGAKKQKRSEDQRRMACPYFKHDPVKYNRSVCCGPGFLGVHRVKEHVYRRHSTPRHSCFRCKSTFKTEAELYDHQISETPCAVVSKTTEEEGCTEEQQRLLKARTKYTTTATEADKWRHMYSVLFPGVGVVPSPC